jgi:hypothetical protein
LNQAISQIQSVTRRFLAAEKAQAAQPELSVQAAPRGILSDHATIVRNLLQRTEFSLSDVLALQPALSALGGAAPAPAASPPADPALPPRLAALLGTEVAPKAQIAARWVNANGPGLLTELINGVAPFIPETLRTDSGTLLLAGLEFMMAQLQKTADMKVILRSTSFSQQDC